MVRCVAYTRKSTDDGLDSDFNSLNAQREACEAYVASQRHESWALLPDHYDAPGFTGANMDRPALQRLIENIKAGKVGLGDGPPSKPNYNIPLAAAVARAQPAFVRGLSRDD